MTDSPHIHEATADTFDALVIRRSREVPVLVDFWASWCQPCRMLMPVLGALAEEYAGKFVLVKVNTEEQQALAADWAVRSLPTVKLFRDGAPVDEFMGALPESAVREFLDRHIDRESDAQRAEARAALEAGDRDRALSLLEAAMDGDPDNPRVVFDLADVLIQAGEYERADVLLNGLPVAQREEPAARRLSARLDFARIASEAGDPDALEAALAARPDDSEARYRLAARCAVRGDNEAALEHLLEILKTDRAFRDDAARKSMLALFELMGPDDPLVPRYRGRMSALLY